MHFEADYLYDLTTPLTAPSHLTNRFKYSGV